jgi:hypothetical protein
VDQSTFAAIKYPGNVVGCCRYPDTGHCKSREITAENFSVPPLLR